MLTISLKTIRQTLFSLAIASLPLNGLAIERWQNPSYIQQSFLTIALQREYNKKTNPRLIRWEKPIDIYFESDFGDTELQRELLSVQLNHLSFITGVPISFNDNKKKSNIFIVFTSYKNLEPKVKEYIGNPNNIRAALKEAICLGHFSVDGQSNIYKGTIIIPVDYARESARFLDCIVEEITQLMGLPNDSNNVYPSIFNDTSIDSYLSPLDYLLLKLLYSKRLTAGMTVQETKRALPLAIKDLVDFGEMKNAARLVREYSLQEYLGD
ncbi:DUF2927 domain-containing protein [Marinomonas sp. 2405UD68-3]|uniref:DUF2927 domain-containing protein n=1 Tax=Marinomonas sp. 2405UD68-3 TaxID=3391835 RepID=UPI0039C9E015